MYRVLASLAAAFGSISAGTIQGVVLEQVSGRPLARAVVRVTPVRQAGSGEGQPLTTRAGRSGQFAFPVVAPGLYLVTAVRDGYFPAAYGQRLPTGHGTPVTVTDDSKLFAELRLRHKGALTGRVLDENGVGTAGVQVFAYRARLPLRSLGFAISDDRGIFRIHGLDPGKYWVRSATTTLDDGSGWLPTFATQARETAEARTYQISVDNDTTDTDVMPEPGTLFGMGGTIACDTDGVVTLTLSSETGQRRMQVACKSPYRFEGLAPAVYELFATLPDGSAAGFLEVFLDHESSSNNVQVMSVPRVEIEIGKVGSTAPADFPVALVARRQDLAETGVEQEIKGPRITLAPGHWEFRARVPAGMYVESITNIRSAPRRPWKAERPTDWFDVFIEPRMPTRIRITVSDQAGQIAGRVMADSRTQAPGAPVFLWPVAESARRSLNGALQTISDTQGGFGFDSLPAGDYRILASFDINEADADLMELARALVIHVEPAQVLNVDLPVWSGP